MTTFAPSRDGREQNVVFDVTGFIVRVASRFCWHF